MLGYKRHAVVVPRVLREIAAFGGVRRRCEGMRTIL